MLGEVLIVPSVQPIELLLILERGRTMQRERYLRRVPNFEEAGPSIEDYKWVRSLLGVSLGRGAQVSPIGASAIIIVYMEVKGLTSAVSMM